MSVENNAISKSLLQFDPEMVAQGAHSLHHCKIARKLAGLAETHCKQGALCARASTTFVSSTMNEWLKRYATANEQGADPLWRIDLVAGDREEIDAQLTYVGCNLADRLRRI